MAQNETRFGEQDEDDLNKLMPLHFRNFTKVDAMEGDTVRLDEYFAARGHCSGVGSGMGQQLEGVQGGPSGATNTTKHHDTLGQAAPEAQAATNFSRHTADDAKANKAAGHAPEQENTPNVSDTLARYLSKPRYAVRGQKRQGTGRVAQKRTFGLDLKQLSRREEESDSEAEWEARDQELARQRAERSAQRQREREGQQRRQSVGASRVSVVGGQKRQSMGPPPEDMVLDSEDEDGMEDYGAGGGDDMEDVQWGQQSEEGDEANGAWKTNPLFDSPQLEKQPAPQPAVPTPLPSQPQTETQPPLPCAPTQTPSGQPIPPSEASISAQVQKIAEAVLAKVGAAVSRGGAKSDGGTQTTPSLELLTLEGRPRILPPVLALPAIPNQEPELVSKSSPKKAGEGSPLLRDVSAAMAMAAQMAEDIDFPALEGSPLQGGGSAGSGEREEAPRKLAFGSPVEAPRNESTGEEENQPEVLNDPPEVPVVEAPTTEPAAASQSAGGSRALVCVTRRKLREKNYRLKAMALKSRKSLAGAGLKIDQASGVRHSTRVRMRPLEWWRNESLTWERSHDSLPTISRVVLLSPDPIWPRNGGRSAAKSARKGSSKPPALTLGRQAKS